MQPDVAAAAAPRLVPALDLASAPAPDLELDAGGLPVDPLLVVDAADVAALGPADRSRVAAVLRATRRCTVLRAVAGAEVPVELADAVDLVLTDAAPATDRWAVAVPDVDGALQLLADRFAATPLAALSYAWLLRQSADLPVPAALSAESALYSTLLAGPEFARWLTARGPARAPDDRFRRVSSRRDGDVLHVRLERPARRNAVDAAMRDALVAALAPAAWDRTLTVQLTAEGPSFSAGGDLDEFGSAPDAARAHVVRLAASVGERIDRIRDRVTVHVHGTCLGAGFEIPCFAGRVVADPGTLLGLPELAMGLVPGAGGTVSVTRRAGRWRAAWLGLSGNRIGVDQALAWGLIDAVHTD